MSDALEARVVTKRFGGLIAVDDVSLDLRPGEMHGLIGPNGSGKTTLLNLISGYYPVDDGSIRPRLDRMSRASPVQDRALSGHRTHVPDAEAACCRCRCWTMPCSAAGRTCVPAFWRRPLPARAPGAKSRVPRPRASTMLHGVGLGRSWTGAPICWSIPRSAFWKSPAP